MARGLGPGTGSDWDAYLWHQVFDYFENLVFRGYALSSAAVEQKLSYAPYRFPSEVALFVRS
jgi:hypothetical protein